jgi:hypothetical protein
MRYLAFVTEDDREIYLPGRAKLHFTKANLVSGMVTMRIYEREVVRYVHILFCFVVLVSVNTNIQLLYSLYPFRHTYTSRVK